MNDAPTEPDFGALLRGHRLRVGLAQRHLADLSTVSVRAIRNLEKRRVSSPRLHTVLLLADGLQLGPTERDVFVEAAQHRPAIDWLHRVNSDRAPDPWLGRGPLIGRDVEVAALSDLLRQSSTRLVSVVGIGGVGKSHLVAETLRRVGEDELDVLWWTRSADEFPDRPHHAVSGRRMVVVLDEGDLISTSGLINLMRAHPRVQFVLNSVVPRGLAGEQILRLGPLSVPDLGIESDAALLREVPSVRLLCAHIRAGDPRFQLDVTNAEIIAEMCRCLDGLPRALEFAGRWALVHSLQELLAKVEHTPLALTAPPMTADSVCSPAARLGHTVSLLGPDSAFFLDVVARGDQRVWSVAEAAASVGASAADAAGAVFTLVGHGLVRPETSSDDTPRFSVLNHVRHLCAGSRRHSRSACGVALSGI
ncbi:helix-turn-helix domain-containing protein [Streptomyces sp. NPDC020707]|uniref:helix-turn-helix domain-containing protein n=1 Tax=Streptomyces sp. NPDC020707 TaxID=3365084 RepID=UPI0037B55D8E